MTHTMGSVTAKMTFDKEYQEQRNHDSVNSVRGVKEGFSRAGEKFLGGIAGGLIGVVSKPVQGAKDEGASGFIKGVGKGLGGLLARLVTGIVDATSTALAGVQNTLEIKEDITRLRYPRVVDESPLEPFRYRLGYAQDLLRSLDADLLPNQRDLMPSFGVDIGDLGMETPLGLGYTTRTRFVVIVTTKNICLIDTRTTTGRLMADWVRPINEVSQVTIMSYNLSK